MNEQPRGNVASRREQELIQAHAEVRLAASGDGRMVSGFRTAWISDALDSLGYRRQVLSSDVVPLSDQQEPICGTAFTVTAAQAEETPERPYVGLLAALDEVTTGEVFIFPSGGRRDAAVWGELLSTACAAKGVVGVVTDGLVRDSVQVLEMEFPTFASGTTPVDINGRLEVVGTRAPVTVGGVLVEPGDVVVADRDGVVIVPARMEREVFNLVVKKVRGEASFREAVRGGLSPSEAFVQFGVL